ncbi:unnamed protein product [Staurois parvus]|uniref:Uncharacterized protein n=1 Tax=Staurois parvus TaxID=386267 RepID=A0ABN9CBY4_9NEOB|nr:unnamed protein product [Staurois parvus]
MTRDCRHSTDIVQEIVLVVLQKMTRDCRHTTGDDQRLQT